MTLRNALIQLSGVAVLAVAVWGFLNMPDRKTWQVAMDLLLALFVLSLATFLISLNLTGQLPRAGRFPIVLGCVLLLLAVLWGTGWVEAQIWNAAVRLASATALTVKKPVRPETISVWLLRAVWLFEWIVLPILSVPLFARAVGVRTYPLWRCAIVYLSLFIVGAWIPHWFIHWVPRIENFWAQVASMAVRFAVAYVLFIACWSVWGRLIRLPQSDPLVR